MDSKERVCLAMTHQQPDRVPVMCQPALGHYFHGLSPEDGGVVATAGLGEQGVVCRFCRRRPKIPSQSYMHEPEPLTRYQPNPTRAIF